MKKNKMSVFGKIWFALLGLLVLFPFYWIAISSLKTSDTIIKPDLWPVSWTLKHYQQLLSTSTFVSGLSPSAQSQSCSSSLFLRAIACTGSISGDVSF